MLTAAYDIGTTAVKGVLMDDAGTVLSTYSEPVTTIFEGERKEQDPEEWWEQFCRISRRFIKESPDGRIHRIIMSGQMQDVIPVGENGKAVGRAILYSDGRGMDQAEKLCAALGKDYLEQTTGNHFDGSLSVPKILWLKENHPEVFEAARYFLISAKDYIIFRLTGKAAGDVTACSTAGGMDIKQKQWDPQILKAAGILDSRMPQIYEPHKAVGLVTKEGAEAAGLSTDTTVYAGIGDAGATTLASGIASPGEYNVNLGTSGWVATMSEKISRTDGGIFNLASFEKDLYINVVPFLNAGNVHKWVSGILSTKGEDGRIDYSFVERELDQSEVGSRGVAFLPYLNGERFPVMDTEVRGTFLGISADTQKGDLARSCLEGVAFSIRQGIESIGILPRKITVIGGGGRVALWNQILADVLHQSVYVYKNAEILPALALNSSVLLAEGKIAGYSDFTRLLQKEEFSVRYEPNPSNIALYDELYKKYLRIYPMVKAYYQA